MSKPIDRRLEQRRRRFAKERSLNYASEIANRRLDIRNHNLAIVERTMRAVTDPDFREMFR